MYTFDRDCRRCELLVESRREIVCCRGRTHNRGYGEPTTVTTKAETYYTHEKFRYGTPGIVDILFIGEAPGKDENTIGLPFIGKAGQLLNWQISYIDIPFYYDITNVVRCLPLDNNSKIRKPTPNEVENCQDHLKSFVKYVQPKGIILLGNIAKDSVDFGIRNISVKHPAFIIRQEFPLGPAKEEALKMKHFIEEVI